VSADALSAARIRQLFEALSEELERTGDAGELYLVGGAVMCLVHEARPSTRDVDAVFRPAARLRAAAARVAARFDLPDAWLNAAVRGWFSDRGEFTPWLTLPHLQVYVPTPEYLLAMKALAMRLGAEFRDEQDVRFLLRLLDVESAAAAMEIVARFYPRERIPPKTSLALEEILGG
jgi:hypothetical protein